MTRSADGVFADFMRETTRKIDGNVREYQAGDVVRLVSHSDACFGIPVGAICKIQEVENKKAETDGNHQYRISCGRIIGFVNKEHIEPRYKVGDKVRLVEHSSYTKVFSVGGVYSVSGLRGYGEDGYGYDGIHLYEISDEHGLVGYVDDKHIEPYKYKEENEMFEVGDKVRIIREKLRVGCTGVFGTGVITEEANSHGLDRRTIYPFPTVNISCGDNFVWKVNLDAVELITKEEELAMWKNARERYGKIHKGLSELMDGLQSTGNKRLGIPECKFCIEHESDCYYCPWGQVMNDGESCSEAQSSWRKIQSSIDSAMEGTSRALEMITDQIAKLEKTDEV